MERGRAVAAKAAPDNGGQTNASSRSGASAAFTSDQAAVNGGAGGMERQSSYNGVVWHPWNSRWEARIRDDKKLRFLGYYASEEQAARAHDLAAHRQQPGNAAILNFPQEPINASQARQGDFQHLQKGTSQFRGVSWNSISEKWRAQLCHGDEVHHLKLHESEVEAAHAYDRLAIKLKKGSAVTNFPAEEYEEYHQYVARGGGWASGNFISLDGGVSSDVLGGSCNNAAPRQNITRSMAMSDFAAPITRARTGGLLVGQDAAEQELAAQALASLSSTCTAFDISPPAEQQGMGHGALMRQATPDVPRGPLQPTPSPYQDSNNGEAPSIQDLKEVAGGAQGVAKSSKFKGVSWHKHSQKWYAYIQHSGKMHGLGYFHDQLEAAAAYDVEAKKVHKGKAVLNFPGRKGSQAPLPRGASREQSRCNSVTLPDPVRAPSVQPGQGIKWNPSDKKFHVYAWSNEAQEVVSVGAYDSKSAAARAMDAEMHAKPPTSFQSYSQGSAFESLQPHASAFTRARRSAAASPFQAAGHQSSETETGSGAFTHEGRPTLETASSVKSPMKQLPSPAQLEHLDQDIKPEVKPEKEDSALAPKLGGGQQGRSRRHPRQAGDRGGAETESDDSSAGFVQNWDTAPTAEAPSHSQLPSRTRSGMLHQAPATSGGMAVPAGEPAPVAKPGRSRRAHPEIPAATGPRLNYRGSSKYKGVSWSERSAKWRAQMWSGNKVHHLGFFDDEESAARCYDAVVVKLRGPSAATNFAGLDPTAVTLADEIVKTITTAPLPKVTTKYRGVRWHYCNRKWEARIFDGVRQVSLGYFDDELEAAQAYDAQAIEKAKVKGGAALVNFPEGASGPQRPTTSAKAEQKPPMPKRKATTSCEGSDPPPKGWGVKRRRDGLKA